MSRKLFLALMTALFLVSIPGAAFAQEEVSSQVHCGDLPEEDCALLVESRMAMSALTSYSAQLELDMSLTDVPTLPGDLSFGLSSDGVFHVDPAWMADMAELQMTPPEDLAEDPEMLADVLSEMYFAIAFDVALDLGMSEDLAQLLSLQAGVPFPESLTLPMRMTEGYFYLNVDDLAQAIPEAEGISGWLGIDLGTLMSEAVRQGMTQMEQGDMPTNPAMAGMGVIGVQQNAEIQEVINEYTQVERLDDAEIDGVEVAQFRSTFDLAGFLSSPVVLGMFMEQMKAQMEADPAMAGQVPLTEQDMEMITSMAPMMLPMLLGGFEAETLTGIGLEDKYVYSTETHVHWDLSTIANMAAAMNQGGPARSRPGASMPMYTLDLTATNGDFDDAPEVEAPEDAIIIPLDALQPGPIM